MFHFFIHIILIPGYSNCLGDSLDPFAAKAAPTNVSFAAKAAPTDISFAAKAAPAKRIFRG